MSDQPTVLVRTQGRIGRLTLNRPKALNALDLPMIRTIAAALHAWRDDPAVQAVVLDAAGGRAFCAGGDIRALRAWVLAGDTAAVEQFFTEEYAVNLALATYPKPYIALIDGLCMGGGIGLTVHGGIRVATEAASFAMPETGIGLFPDVGATFALPRLRGAHGMYLALTGERIGGAEATRVGLATHFVPQAALAGLADRLAENGPAVLAEATQMLTAELPDVTAFAAGSVLDIVAALQAAPSNWARATLETLRRVSPSALLWTFAAMRRGAGLTLAQALAAELALTRHVTRHPDFTEGVRAMVVDKDRTPHWTPARIEDVDPATIAAMLDA